MTGNRRLKIGGKLGARPSERSSAPFENEGPKELVNSEKSPAMGLHRKQTCVGLKRGLPEGKKLVAAWRGPRIENRVGFGRDKSALQLSRMKGNREKRKEISLEIVCQTNQFAKKRSPRGKRKGATPQGVGRGKGVTPFQRPLVQGTIGGKSVPSASLQGKVG